MVEIFEGAIERKMILDLDADRWTPKGAVGKGQRDQGIVKPETVFDGPHPGADGVADALFAVGVRCHVDVVFGGLVDDGLDLIRIKSGGGPVCKDLDRADPTGDLLANYLQKFCRARGEVGADGQIDRPVGFTG